MPIINGLNEVFIPRRKEVLEEFIISRNLLHTICNTGLKIITSGMFELAENFVKQSIENIGKMYTFRFNGKSSLLKLLYTLTRSCEGTPLQPLRIRLLRNRLSLTYLAQNFYFSIFVRRTTEQGERARISHERAPLPNPISRVRGS